jgi:hypothetical protein
MDNRAVFMEYAHSDSWIAVHLAQYFAVLLIIGGLVALYYSVTAKPAAGEHKLEASLSEGRVVDILALLFLPLFTEMLRS